MRNNIIKRVICFAVAFVMAMSTFSAFAAAQVVEPYFNNTVTASNMASVSSSGKLTITNSFAGGKTVFSKAIITTYVEKRFSVCSGAEWISVRQMTSGST